MTNQNNCLHDSEGKVTEILSTAITAEEMVERSGSTTAQPVKPTVEGHPRLATSNPYGETIELWAEPNLGDPTKKTFVVYNPRCREELAFDGIDDAVAEFVLISMCGCETVLRQGLIGGDFEAMNGYELGSATKVMLEKFCDFVSRIHKLHGLGLLERLEGDITVISEFTEDDPTTLLLDEISDVLIKHKSKLGVG